MHYCCVGIDVGGSHISLSFIDCETGNILDNAVYKRNIDSHASAFQIMVSWESFITGIMKRHVQETIIGIGVAIPGPFDYERGISKIEGVRKYESLFSLNIKQILKNIFKNSSIPVTFVNDATGYALGEYYGGAIRGSKRAIFISLGTGFGSAFLVNGIPLTSGEDVPENGYLYNWPVEDGIADDKLSTRWFLQEWYKKTGNRINGVKELAEKARERNLLALEIFARFTENLSQLLNYWIKRFAADSLVIGGNIAKASDLFWDGLISSMDVSMHPGVNVKISGLWENAPLVGAAMYHHQMNKDRFTTLLRQTSQTLVPETTLHTPPGKYDLYPGFTLGNGKIKTGFKALAEWIIQHKTVIVEGYVGVLWDHFVDNIDKELAAMGKKALWFHIDAALHPSQVIDEMLVPYLGGDDPVFGKITDKQLSDWYDSEKLAKIKPDPQADVNIVVGCGASLCGWKAPVIYMDLPKNELQFRMRAGCIRNLGADAPMDSKQMYKRFYFVDWRVLNEHKKRLLPQIDLIVDEQRIDRYLFMRGDDLRKGLSAMGRNFFRVRPWFEPGVWGGTWMKNHFEGLSDGTDNLAWSFELMVLENGLLFESDHRLLEVSFDFLMYNSNLDVLGDAAPRFEYDFPIRFDFLDTFDGGNLSIQCHPSNAYIKERFGMPFTQDETYYIMDCKEDAKVYLGFREGVDKEELYNDLIASQNEAIPVYIPHYVQVFPAEKHRLFLIPNGTIHASGKNNLVLEVSSAPYIFTFKIYDWLRLDLDGKPRPINIEHAMNNLRFDRQGEVVEKELISKPYVLERTESFVLEHLPTHKTHFYDIHRYTFEHEICIETREKFHVWMLVEGSSVTLKTQNGMEQSFNYAETFVVPAAAKRYSLINNGDKPAVMIKSFVKRT